MKINLHSYLYVCKACTAEYFFKRNYKAKEESENVDLKKNLFDIPPITKSCIEDGI